MAKAIAYVFVLIAKLPGVLISFAYGRRRGVNVFRNELLKAGMDRHQAEELAHMYKTMLTAEWKMWFRSKD